MHRRQLSFAVFVFGALALTGCRSPGFAETLLVAFAQQREQRLLTVRTVVIVAGSLGPAKGSAVERADDSPQDDWRKVEVTPPEQVVGPWDGPLSDQAAETLVEELSRRGIEGLISLEKNRGRARPLQDVTLVPFAEQDQAREIAAERQADLVLWTGIQVGEEATSGLSLEVGAASGYLILADEAQPNASQQSWWRDLRLRARGLSQLNDEQQAQLLEAFEELREQVAEHELAKLAGLARGLELLCEVIRGGRDELALEERLRLRDAMVDYVTLASLLRPPE